MLHNYRDQRIWSGSGSLLQKLHHRHVLTKLFGAGAGSVFPRHPKLDQQSYQRVQDWNLGLELGEDFYLPTYCIGQTVFHCMKVNQGEILHPVLINGLFWTGGDWEYSVYLPEEYKSRLAFNNEIGQWMRYEADHPGMWSAETDEFIESIVSQIVATKGIERYGAHSYIINIVKSMRNQPIAFN